MFRTTNLETHQYKKIGSSIKSLTGDLEGEFLKATGMPNGRCRFMTEEGETNILCYFKNGKL